MSYIDDYNDNVNNKKIPYDDIPISRNYESKKSSRRQSVSTPVTKILIVLVAVLFVANIVLCSTAFYYLKHGKVKNVNYYYPNIEANQESISTYAMTTALMSTICVSAGGNATDYDSFFTHTLSKGSGVIYRVDGNTIYFITCYHVVNGHDNIWVLLPSQRVPIKVSLVSYSSHYDIAVLSYRASNPDDVLDGCTPIKTYDSNYLTMGDKVFAVGNPLSGGFSITEGVVSRLNTLITIDSNNYESREIQTSAAINPGNSGGGLFNSEGRFVGLVNAKLNTAKSGTSTITVAGTAYAIPGTLTLSIAESIIKNKSKTQRVDLGAVFGYDDDRGSTIYSVKDEFGTTKMILASYVVVSSVTRGSIAYQKLHAGDQIVSIEFDVLEKGERVHKKIQMFSKYTFEDYSFAIVSGSDIIFNIIEDGVGEEEKQVVIEASAFRTIE